MIGRKHEMLRMYLCGVWQGGGLTRRRSYDAADIGSDWMPDAVPLPRQPNS